jgi:DNA-binding LacI/PurR family transcriptional regulator
MVNKASTKSGERVVTMREVARAAGVSIKTVSNVVNDYQFVSDVTRSKVNAAIDQLGYALNVSARNLRTGHTGVIALAIPDLQMPYFAQLSSLVIEEAKKVDLRVIVEPTLYSREGEIDALHGSRQSMVDGIIFSPLELGQEDVEQLEVDYPLVLLGERIFTDRVDQISTENVEGAKRATSYLIETGCRRIAVLGTHPGEKVGSAALRLQGYREALDEAGMEFDPSLVGPVVMWHRIDGVNAMNELLTSGTQIDGVVALNDMLASGAMHAIQMQGLRIPEDISIIGFDNSDDSQYLSPALTTISPGLEAVARLSVKVIKDRIEGVAPFDVPDGDYVSRKVTSTLVVRDSTKPLGTMDSGEKKLY